MIFTARNNLLRFLLLSLFILSNTLVAYNQTLADSGYQAFSDFHIHTTFKNYYRHVEDPDSTIKYAANPGYINEKYGRKGWQPFVRSAKDKIKGRESNMANYDQADYTNLKGLSGSVLCASITPPEKIMLSTKTDRWINKLMVSKMNMQRQAVLAAENNSSFKEFLGEYYFITNQDSVNEGNKILLAKNNADLKRIVKDGGIGLVLTIEGGHTLFGNDVLSKLKNLKSSGCDSACRLEVLSNIEKLHELPHRVFFITVAHFGWNKMFGNAKSLDKPGLRRDLLTTASFSDGFKQTMFAKYGDGIIGNVRSYNLIDTTIKTTGGRKIKIRLPYSRDEYSSNIGYEVMHKLLDADNDFHKPIYLDCKHMDIKSRFQYYEYIDSINIVRRAASRKTIPIIASHIGLSGKKRKVAIATAQYPLSNSYEELIFGETFYKVQMNDHDLFWRNYTRLLKREDRHIYFGKDEEDIESFNPFDGNTNYNTLGWFYPWEINFCDDEIKYIYDSEGIIGLNMDSRILGFTMPNYSARYKKYLREKFVDVHGKRNTIVGDGSKITFDEYYKAEPLLRNIFRVVEVSGKQDSTAWDRIAIGSDFDGFIQPITLIPTAESIPSFHKKMIGFVKTFVVIHNQQKLMYGLTAETVMQKFFYTNGRDFIFKNFQD